MKKLPAHEASGGNVFADLGLPDADELLRKSQIVVELARLMKRKKLGQSGAAAIAGVAQPDLSNLLRGKLRGFSVERLLRMPAAFGRDVDIVVRPARRARARGGIKITSKVA